LSRVVRLGALALLLSILVAAWPPRPLLAQPAAPAVAARAAYLVDFNSGRVLYEMNADEPIPPASLTKLMTLYLTYEALAQGRIRRDDLVPISERAWAQNPELWGSSLMWLEPGQKVTVGEVMLGVAVPSGNDAAIALAEKLAGTVEAFVSQMNAKARELGLENTRFVDPHGLSPENRITARDAARLAIRYITDFPQALTELHSVKEFTYPQPHNLSPDKVRRGTQPIRQENRNWLLWSYPGADGLKTGYIEEAGYNLIATAKRGDMRLVAVLLGTESEAAREAQGTALLNWGFENWTSLQLFPADRVMGRVRVWKGAGDQVDVVPERPLWVAIPKGSEAQLVETVSLRKSVVAPVRQGQVLGEAVAVLGDEEVGRVNLVAREAVPPGGFFKRLWDSIRLFVAGLLARWL